MVAVQPNSEKVLSPEVNRLVSPCAPQCLRSEESLDSMTVGALRMAPLQTSIVQFFTCLSILL